MRMAFTIRVSPLALFRFASANAFFASLHSSVNHGANVLPHLLGFLGDLIVISFTTPAFTAYSRMYFSTAVALVSLVLSASSTNADKSLRNSGVCVNSRQIYADLL